MEATRTGPPDQGSKLVAQARGARNRPRLGSFIVVLHNDRLLTLWLPIWSQAPPTQRLMFNHIARRSESQETQCPADAVASWQRSHSGSRL